MKFTNTNPFRYRGYYYDNETGFYYLNARYYDPSMGRFISPDVLTILDETKGQINGLNLYMYCNNNPIMYVDPSGCLAFFIACLLIGLVLGAGYGLYKDWQDNNKIDGSIGVKGYATYIGLGGLIGAGIGLIASAVLTGSLFSSIGTVKLGAYTLYSMYILGGSTGAGLMMVDNISNSINYKTHIFWSGGEISMNGATYLACQIDGTTLDMTRVGQYLTKVDASYELWKIASVNFANQVHNGTIAFVVQNQGGVDLVSTWATIEYPILIKKGIEIVYTVLGWL